MTRERHERRDRTGDDSVSPTLSQPLLRHSNRSPVYPRLPPSENPIIAVGVESGPWHVGSTIVNQAVAGGPSDPSTAEPGCCSDAST